MTGVQEGVPTSGLALIWQMWKSVEPVATVFLMGLATYFLSRLKTGQVDATTAAKEAAQASIQTAKATVAVAKAVKVEAVAQSEQLTHIEHSVNSAAEKAARREEQLIQQLARLGQPPEPKPANGQPAPAVPPPRPE